MWVQVPNCLNHQHCLPRSASAGSWSLEPELGIEPCTPCVFSVGLNISSPRYKMGVCLTTLTQLCSVGVSESWGQQALSRHWVGHVLSACFPLPWGPLPALSPKAPLVRGCFCLPFFCSFPGKSHLCLFPGLPGPRSDFSTGCRLVNCV